MPMYEAKCRRCGVTYSYLCRSEDRDKPGSCPGCGGVDTYPIMSATPTSFKFADRSAHKGR